MVMATHIWDFIWKCIIWSNNEGLFFNIIIDIIVAIYGVSTSNSDIGFSMSL